MEPELHVKDYSKLTVGCDYFPPVQPRAVTLLGAAHRCVLVSDGYYTVCA